MGPWRGAGYRGRGAGRQLVEAVERWAAARGLDEISVRSNVVRPDAHPFYERLGYIRAKTQHAYRKAVAAPNAAQPLTASDPAARE